MNAGMINQCKFLFYHVNAKIYCKGSKNDIKLV
jgi:hypothetical protein